MSKKKYIGEKVIAKIEKELVTFEDGTTRECTPSELLVLVSDEPKDESEVKYKVVETVCGELLEILEKFNIRKGDMQSIVETLIQSYNRQFNIAVGKAFGTFEEGKHHSAFAENVRISDLAKFK